MTTDNVENQPAGDPPPPPGPYAQAIEDYLEAATWLTPADAPFKVHARSIAASLDRQLAAKGEVQSALASSFDKVMIRLEARRPPASPAPPNPKDPSPDGTVSIFEQLPD